MGNEAECQESAYTFLAREISMTSNVLIKRLNFQARFSEALSLSALRSISKKGLALAGPFFVVLLQAE